MGITDNPMDTPNAGVQATAAEPVLAGVQVCTNTAVRLAARRLGQLYDDALAPLNLKATQLALMGEIAKFKSAEAEGPALQDLAGRLAIQLSALTHALRPLVRDGIVELRPDAQDRRTKRGVLTPLGKRLLSDAIVRWATANERVEAVLGPASAASLRALADQVASDAFMVAYQAENPARVPPAP
ncbi:MarR family winged helix-turn-helix transcriptional regulator [Acidovorax sp. NCPPB 3576]|uniref:MarR family winged helix-turn-helix transcriptional regulator n=1 Tax=Acidovorax sp. NCPPB 3576 TaxID=2940488 RepID=UPI00234BBC1A|nr:MarR family transcriptional regulator [Acidovorax sp. NCPPB 3576]WCM89866.1 MarR family transcriptional regulator [Acidovorax sp. NCPPB 3576]